MDRKKNLQNFMLVDNPILVGRYGFPLIEKTDFVPDTIVPFSEAKKTKFTDCGLHFFIDDYRFERLWTHPNKYLPLLQKFSCIFAPDFSLYIDMPPVMKIWNVYRNRLIGQWMQKNGICVVPTVAWAEPASYEYCFDGIEPGGTIAISTVGARRNSFSIELWKRGAKKMIEILSPTNIVLYGSPIDISYGNINVKHFDNSILNHLHNL